MKVATKEFLLDLSDVWHVEQEAGRLVAHDEEGREIIVTVTSVVDVLPQQGETGPVGVRDMVIDRALQAARKAASHAELDTLEELAPVKDAAFPLWRVCSVSKDLQVFFAQLVFAGTKSVGLLTFEAPASAESRARFEGVEVGIGPS